MRILKEFYFHIFYSFYQMDQITQPWWSEDKAVFFLSVFETLLLSLIGVFLQDFIEVGFLFSNFFVYTLFLILPPGLANYFLFLYKDKWKKIIHDQAKLSMKKKVIYRSFMVLIIVTIFGSLFLAEQQFGN